MKYTIAKDIRTEKVIQKSRFICSLKKVKTEPEALAFIKAVKKEFWDASHNCSAYIIDERRQRSHDDGEPAGTAGAPMLGVLRNQALSKVAVVVTRYFGGIKLGAGGLSRAYAGSVAQAVGEAGIARRVKMGLYEYTCEAAEAGKILNLFYQQQLFTLVDTNYGSCVIFTIRMEVSVLPEAETWLTNMLQKKAKLCQIGYEYDEICIL